MAITLSERRDLPRQAVLELYRANGWSSADKPEALMAALAGSHAVVTAWEGDRLLGLGNALSDGTWWSTTRISWCTRIAAGGASAGGSWRG